MCYRRCAFVNHLAEWAKTQLSNCCVATHHFALYSSVVDRGQERLLRRDEAKGLEVYVTERTDIITCSVYFFLFTLLKWKYFNPSTDSVYFMYARFNLLKPTGYAMHQQFNIQQLYAVPTLYLCVSYLSENKQRLVTRKA